MELIDKRKVAGYGLGAKVIAFFGLPAVFVALLILVSMVISIITINVSQDSGGVMPGADGKGGHADVPAVVRQYEPMVKEIATKYGLQDYTEFFLAQIMQESGGDGGGDIFQSSESAGFPPGTITDPIASTEQAMRYWSEILRKGSEMGISFWGVTQSYNFGPGYLNYLKEQNQIHSEEIAKDFALAHATRAECGWRTPFCYGDFTYVNKILKYFQSAVGAGGDTFNAVMAFALKYENYPYQWGGVGDPSFDCSGLWMMAFRQVGINLPRTAEEQYKATQRITKEELQPGDLIFFTGTSDHAYISHIGLYVGDNRMYDSNSDGIGYTELTSYWTSKIAGYGRVVR
ncbi:bifunctional lytic transglycosylase/C40 family peptidase [Ectobacillus funiculus]|uniref:Lysozyme family protein n=1 Tax=Ectobacillus funiculus TaxID=137993 RepID=A0ABV5W9C8_9BACI